MQHRYVSNNGSSRLILIFAGRGSDGGDALDGISRPGYDVMVVWDYRSFHIDWSIVNAYKEICILACGIGVFAVSETTHAIDHKTTMRIALDGTPNPICDKYGIPEACFTNTLNHLAGSALREELESVLTRTYFGVATPLRWDLAIISRDDADFPAHNQRRAWQSVNVPQVEFCEGHRVDLQNIIDSYFVDKSSVAQRFLAAVDTYESHAAVQADVVHQLMAAAKELGILPAITAAPDALLEIGSGSGLLTRRLARYIDRAEFEIWDLSAPLPENLPKRLKISFRNCDAEMQIMRSRPCHYNLIFTASTVEWFNSPALFLKNSHRALADGGILAMTTYTKGNLHEISDITHTALPLVSVERWREMVAPYFEVLYCRAFIRDLDFESPRDVLRHIKAIGANSLSATSQGIGNVREIIRRYPMRLDGLYHLTYCPLILILRKK
ncbi:MAG: DUF452 family protein [Muribaculaceae bacterium]|nr:DUF452 family protein [Muribaculaceae bacterium]